MGAVWSSPQPPPPPPPPPHLLSVWMGAGGDEPFVSPLSLHVRLSPSRPSPAGKSFVWRVEFEVDVADARDRRVLVRTPPIALAGEHRVRVATSALSALADGVPPDRLCNVCAVHFVLAEAAADGRDVRRITAVVEVFRAERECKLRTGELRRRVYAPPPDGGTGGKTGRMVDA